MKDRTRLVCHIHIDEHCLRFGKIGLVAPRLGNNGFGLIRRNARRLQRASQIAIQTGQTQRLPIATVQL